MSLVQCARDVFRSERMAEGGAARQGQQEEGEDTYYVAVVGGHEITPGITFRSYGCTVATANCMVHSTAKLFWELAKIRGVTTDETPLQSKL